MSRTPTRATRQISRGEGGTPRATVAGTDEDVTPPLARSQRPSRHPVFRTSVAMEEEIEDLTQHNFSLEEECRTLESQLRGLQARCQDLEAEQDSKQLEGLGEERRRARPRPRSTLAAPVARTAGALSRPIPSRTSLRPSDASGFRMGAVSSRASTARSSVRSSADGTTASISLSLPSVTVRSVDEAEQQASPSKGRRSHLAAGLHAEDRSPSGHSSDGADNAMAVIEEEEHSFLQDELLEARAHVDEAEHDLIHVHSELEQAKQEAVSAKVASRMSQARAKQLQVEVEEAHLVLNTEARTVEKLQRDLHELQEVLVQERRRKAASESHGVSNFVDVDAFQAGGDSLAAQLLGLEEPGPEPAEAFEEELQEMARIKSMQKVEAVEAERVAVHKVWMQELTEAEVESERKLLLSEQHCQEADEKAEALQVQVDKLTAAREEEAARNDVLTADRKATEAALHECRATSKQEELRLVEEFEKAAEEHESTTLKAKTEEVRLQEELQRVSQEHEESASHGADEQHALEELRLEEAKAASIHAEQAQEAEEKVQALRKEMLTAAEEHDELSKEAEGQQLRLQERAQEIGLKQEASMRRAGEVEAELEQLQVEAQAALRQHEEQQQAVEHEQEILMSELQKAAEEHSALESEAAAVNSRLQQELGEAMEEQEWLSRQAAEEQQALEEAISEKAQEHTQQLEDEARKQLEQLQAAARGHELEQQALQNEMHQAAQAHQTEQETTTRKLQQLQTELQDAADRFAEFRAQAESEEQGLNSQLLLAAQAHEAHKQSQELAEQEQANMRAELASARREHEAAVEQGQAKAAERELDQEAEVRSLMARLQQTEQQAESAEASLQDEVQKLAKDKAALLEDVEFISSRSQEASQEALHFVERVQRSEAMFMDEQARAQQESKSQMDKKMGEAKLEHEALTDAIADEARKERERRWMLALEKGEETRMARVAQEELAVARKELEDPYGIFKALDYINDEAKSVADRVLQNGEEQNAQEEAQAPVVGSEVRDALSAGAAGARARDRLRARRKGAEDGEESPKKDSPGKSPAAGLPRLSIAESTADSIVSEGAGDNETLDGRSARRQRKRVVNNAGYNV